MPEDEPPAEERSDGDEPPAEDPSDGDEPPDGDPSDNPSSVAFRGILIVAFGFGALAVVVGVAGLFVIFTGGTGGGESTDVLGELRCEEFGGDPAVGHEASYSIGSTIRSGQAIDSLNSSVNESSVTVELRVNGELLNASARTADGRPVSVEQENSSVVRVTRSETTPFRLWVDTLSTRTTRTVFDICPSE